MAPSRGPAWTVHSPLSQNFSQLQLVIRELVKSVSVLVDLSLVEVCESQRVFRHLIGGSLSAEPKTDTVFFIQLSVSDPQRFTKFKN